jgi:GT2 family glycosyltransferase
MDDPDRVNTCGNQVHYTGLTLCRGMGAPCCDLVAEEPVAAVSGAAFAISRALFFALDGFDERFFLYMEDTDLSWRARLAGFKCICVPRSVAYHHYTLRFGPLKTFYQERNRYLLMLKSLRWRSLLLLLPAFLLAELVTWGFAILRDRRHLANKIRAYAWIVQHWEATMEARRQVQSMRRVPDRDLLAGCTPHLAYEQVGEGPAVHLAHWAFDPLFLTLYWLALRVIRW